MNFMKAINCIKKVTIDKATLVESLKKDDAVESQMIDTDKKGFFYEAEFQELMERMCNIF